MSIRAALRQGLIVSAFAAAVSGCGIRVDDRPQDRPTPNGIPPCTADLPFGSLFRDTIECMSPVTFPRIDPFEKPPPLTPLDKANIQYMLCLNRQDEQRKNRQRVEVCRDPKPRQP